MTYASSAQSAAGNGRGLIRRAPIALIAGLALIASLAFASAASATEAPPVNHVTSATAEYTTAHVTGTVESDVTPGFSDEFASLWAFEYAVKGTPPNGSWTGNPCCNGQIAPSGKATVEADLTGLKPDTEYEVRLGSFNGYNGFAYTTSEELEPNHVFTTKHVNKPSVSLAISDVTLDSAHFSGTVQTNAPAGPLSAAEKAAYQTTWNVVCRPQCPTVAEPVVIEGDEVSGPVSLDPIRLETNTYYEVELIGTNAAGSAIVEDFFTTPHIAAKVNPSPGGSSGQGAYSIGGVVTPYNTKITDCHFEYGPTTEYVYSAPCSPQPIGRNEFQAFAIGATAGQFRLVFRGQETGDIAVGADEKVVEEELQALSTIGPQGVTEVTREFGFFFVAYYVHFSGPLSGTNLGPLRVINGTNTVYIEGQGIPPACCTGDTLGFSGAIVEGGNNDPVVVEAHLTGLTPGATYHYKLFATNDVGTVTSEDIRFVAPLAVGDKPCPNEAVRIENNSTRLPECRAYELVTSAFKASSGAALGQLSINDGTVGYTSRAGNINNSGYGGLFANFYVAVRHDTGWETISNLNGPRGSFFAPPNNLFGGQLGPVQYSTDLLRSVWYLSKNGAEPLSPYLRNEDGTFTRISDMPEYHIAPEVVLGGISQDLKRMFWLGKDYDFLPDLWAPGVGQGLYEFVGTGHTNDPQRIDLDNSGNPISDCSIGSFTTGSSDFDGFSPDGNIVWFTVKACEGHPAWIYARADSSKAYFASESQCTRTSGDLGGACNAPVSPQYEGVSHDGSRAVFSTTQQLVNGDTDNTKDLYEYVLPTASEPNPSPNLIEISGAAPNAKLRNLTRISNDGRRVYFIAQGALASNHDAHDQPPHAGDFNLYVWEQTAAHPNGETKFVTRLEDPPNNYDVSAFGGYRAQVTPDGRYMVFLAYHPMVETDTDNSIDVYRYDAVKGEMTRVSVDTAGVGGNADFSDADLGFRDAISNNGQQIVFTTSEALSPEDGNGGPDAYLWQDGHTSLISTGAVGGGAGAVSIDGSGQDIYITSGQQLTANDIDEVSDVYDARRNGGFSFKEPAPCAGEACQPAGTRASDNGGASTDQAGGEGNYQPATVSIKAMSSSQRAKLAAGGRAEVPLKVSGPGKISLKGAAQIGKRSSEVIAASSRAVQAGVVNVPISLSRGALSQLRNRGVLNVRLSAVVADSETATATLKLKTAEARHKRSKKGRG